MPAHLKRGAKFRMCFFDSKVSKCLLDDTGSVQRDLSAYVTDVRGLPGPRALNETTALGDSGAKFIPGLEDVTIVVHGLFDDTASPGPDAVLGPLRTHASAVDFEYGPKGHCHREREVFGEALGYQLRTEEQGRQAGRVVGDAPG